VLPSSRHVKVVVDGLVVAETNRPHLLFETGLPNAVLHPADRCALEVYVDGELQSQPRTDWSWSVPGSKGAGPL
jgi:uncharacterized protein (DUF427 family)